MEERRGRDIIDDTVLMSRGRGWFVVSLAPPLGLSGIVEGASNHTERMMCGRGTAVKLPIP